MRMMVKQMKRLFLLFFGMSILIPSARAHEVHASHVSVTVKGNKLEVLQSTPLKTVRDMTKKKLEKQSISDQEVLMFIGGQWLITADNKNCGLQKQAYRFVHNDAEMQLRYLFECSVGQEPTLMALPWLMQTPQDHFITMNLTVEGKSNTVVFQRQPLVIDLT